MSWIKDVERKTTKPRRFDGVELSLSNTTEITVVRGLLRAPVIWDTQEVSSHELPESPLVLDWRDDSRQ